VSVYSREQDNNNLRCELRRKKVQWNRCWLGSRLSATQRRIDVCLIQYGHVTTGMLCDFTKTNV